MNALAVHIALRMKIWNIGSEGQFFMGAWAAAGIGIYWGGPRYLVLLVMARGGRVAGAVWILVPAVARARWQVNEIITTLLLNFVAIQWVAWFSFDLWRDRAAAVVQSTPVVQARLPFFPGSRTLFISIFVPLVIAAMTFVVFRYTRWGYEVDMIGGNPRAAEFAGIRVTRRIVVVMLHLGGDRRRLGDAAPGRAGPAAELLDIEQLRLVGVHRRRAGRQLGHRRRRRLGLHRRHAARRDHAAIRRVVGVRGGRGLRPGAARHRGRRGRRPLPHRAGRQPRGGGIT